MSKEDPYLHLVVGARQVHIKDGSTFPCFKFIRNIFKVQLEEDVRKSIFSRVKFEDSKIVNLC